MIVRNSKPEYGNKFYNNGNNNGYSWCINGNPTDIGCNVLSNCVGYACGRFNEIIGEMKYPQLNCNAENFIERAISVGLKISNVPTLGGIMVWQKGDTLSGSDGAGHVEVVERIDSENQIYTSSSAWSGNAFYNVLRNNNNGKWGVSKDYHFRGCIINPAIGDIHFEKNKTLKSNDEIANEVIQGLWKNYPERKTLLENAGYNYSEIQKLVNQKINNTQHIYYTVKKGDNLTLIAHKYGTTWQEIYNKNKDKIKNPNLIYEGQQLLIK